MELTEALKKYMYSILITMLLAGTVTLDSVDKVYYCEERELVQECVRLSSTAKTCYNSYGKGTRCFEGWKDLEAELKDIEKNSITVNADNKIWSCKLNIDMEASSYTKCYSGSKIAYLGEKI